MLESIRAGFAGISGWLAIGTKNQGHCYILNPSGTPSRNVKYFIFKKLSNTSNYGYALDINEPSELKSTAALIKGNLMTVWVINTSTTDVHVDINPTDRTISESTVKRTRWHTSLDVQGVSEHIPVKAGNQSVWSSIPGESVCCFEILLEPEDFPFTKIEAENFDAKSGMRTENSGDTGGTQNLAYIGHGNWAKYESLTLGENTVMRFRVARPAGRQNGWVEVRLDDPDGSLAGKIAVPETGNWQVYETIETPLEAIPGTYDVYLKFVEVGSNTGASLFNANWLSINQPLSQPASPTNLTATRASANQINLTWNAGDHATAYTIQRSTSQGGPYTTVATGITTTNYTDTQDLTPGTRHYYIIRSVNVSLESSGSTEAAATPADSFVMSDLVIDSFELGHAPDNTEQATLTIQRTGLGQFYQAQTTDNLQNPAWTNVGSVFPGTGGVLELAIPFNHTGKTQQFFRVHAWLD